MKKLLLATTILLSTVSANASCPDEKIINDEVSKATSYLSFKDAMDKFGGLVQLSSSGNVAMSDWGQLKDAIATNGFTRVKDDNVCLFHSTGKVGYLALKLNKK